MYSLRVIIFTMLTVCLCLVPSGCSRDSDPEIRVTGSTTILPFMTRVSNDYSEKGKDRPKIEVRSGGSIKGIEALIADRCDIAMCSTPISAHLRVAAEGNGVQIKGFPFAYDLIVPIVHPSNPIRDLSVGQLAGIYQGTLLTWDALGGEPEPIEVVARAPSSGTGEIWKQVVLRSARIKQGSVVQDSNSGVLAYVAEHPHAIGYVSFAILNHEVKALSVDGVLPSIDNVKAGKYPVSRKLYLYVNEKELPYNVKSLLVFILSSKGQQLVKETGFIPLNLLQ